MKKIVNLKNIGTFEVNFKNLTVNDGVNWKKVWEEKCDYCPNSFAEYVAIIFDKITDSHDFEPSLHLGSGKLLQDIKVNLSIIEDRTEATYELTHDNYDSGWSLTKLE